MVYVEGLPGTVGEDAWWHDLEGERGHMARTRDAAFGQLVTRAECPVYALDDRRMIVYCNAACGDLLGVTPEALVGMRCDYRTAATGETLTDVAASMCPQPEVFAGTATVARVPFLRADGSLLSRRVTFQPLGSDPARCVGVVAFVGEDDALPSVESEASDLHHRLWSLRRGLRDACHVEELIGTSAAIRRVTEQMEWAGRGQVRVLVHGPSGSGREHVARLLHQRGSADPWGQLVPLCCPLLDAELLQSTIRCLMRDQAANESGGSRRGEERGGAPTLLLLEVDQLPAEGQAELAGFLALPGFQIYSIATSQRSLIELAREGRYREDLAYALSTLEIELPALCERREDIPLLCQYFVEKYNAEGGRQLSGFSSEALDELTDYTWPDNIDELSEYVELACRAAEGPLVEVSELPAQIGWAARAAAHPAKPDEPIDLDAFLLDIERELVRRALARAKGNKTRAAQLLGVHRARLLRKVEQFGLT
jgi:DNA-binding NtrC family response regulator